jgi:hypothetical protein
MHPDADQLSIFVEGAASKRERDRMLAHLAECEECRDAVFLMQRPVENAAAKKESREWAWRRWFLPAGLAGAVLACGLSVVLIYVRPRTRVSESARQNAEVRQPEIAPRQKTVVPSGNAGPAAQPEKAKNDSRRGPVVMDAARQGAGGATRSKAPNVDGYPSAAGSPTQGMKTGVPSGPVGTMAEAGATPKHGVQAGVNSAVVQEMPLYGRIVPAPPRAQATAPRDRTEAQQVLPALRVERPSGQNDTLSGVSGRVTDASGAVIPKATVALRESSGNGNTLQTPTGADGSFQLTGIPAGRYKLTVTAPGFMSNQQSIDLKPSELAMLQPVLAVGAATETVTVTSSTPLLQTESASVGSIAAALPSRLPVASSVSLGKRILSLDHAGTLYLSHNAGKNWKKVNPRWTGKAVRIDLAATDAEEALDKHESSGAKSAMNVFQLTTDTGAQWTSNDGTHWHPK